MDYRSVVFNLSSDLHIHIFFEAHDRYALEERVIDIPVALCLDLSTFVILDSFAAFDATFVVSHVRLASVAV